MVLFQMLRNQHEDIQQQLSEDPSKFSLHCCEEDVRANLDKLLLHEESMYKQRSWDFHINLGDGNTRYFYGLMKMRHSDQSYISKITDYEGNTFTDPSAIQ